MWDLLWVDARALVFLLNRHELAAGTAAQPDYRSAVHVDIRLPLRRELEADTLKGRLKDWSEKHKALASVTRWDGNDGRGSDGGDLRVSNRLGTTFFWQYARFVHATRDAEDLRFVQFLLASGLAKKWGATDELAAALQTSPME